MQNRIQSILMNNSKSKFRNLLKVSENFKTKDTNQAVLKAKKQKLSADKRKKIGYYKNK